MIVEFEVLNIAQLTVELKLGFTANIGGLWLSGQNVLLCSGSELHSSVARSKAGTSAIRSIRQFQVTLALKVSPCSRSCSCIRTFGIHVIGGCRWEGFRGDWHVKGEGP
jgi:hypothetical protein